MKTNPLWKVTVNWFGELHIVWTHAVEKGVLKNTAHQLERKGVPYDKDCIYRKLRYGDVQCEIEKIE